MHWIYIIVALIVALSMVFLCIFAIRKSLNSLSLWLMIIVFALLIAFLFLYGVPYYRASEFETHMRQNYPVMNLIAQQSPEEFQSYMDQTRTAIQHSKGQQVVAVYTGEFINAQLSKYIANASNQSIYDYTVTTLNCYQKLYNSDPSLVIDMEFASFFPNHINFDNLEKGVEACGDTITVAKLNIIESAIRSPSSGLNSEEVVSAQQSLHEIFQELAAKYGDSAIEETFTRPYDSPQNKTLTAQIIVEFYEKLIIKGPVNTGIILKYLLTQKPGNGL
ncbi:hypothetical protein Lbir_2757 [Legionella birminghamensis]|uniref:Uncharacterized protein n=1 Tax=Legionella birminghamensis TaxID=28083 RepID=A0A378I8N0_9GAMM|nr:hypothetical protein [Legionella birminghamensis]KTC68155.1 hypothetical protein Lbir_2757 [Legionella birminghamensis]STX31135.1 Uncharacterised protein [Legionella birminghamensis]